MGTIGALLQKLGEKSDFLDLPLNARPSRQGTLSHDMGSDRSITSEVGQKSDFLVFPLKARPSKARATLSNDMGTIGALLQKLEKKVLYSIFLSKRDLVRHEEHFPMIWARSEHYFRSWKKKVIFSIFLSKHDLSTQGTLSHDMGTIGALLQKFVKKGFPRFSFKKHALVDTRNTLPMIYGHDRSITSEVSEKKMIFSFLPLKPRS